MIPVNLDAIGCDSYAFSGHKWLGGPHETGVLYIRRDRLEAVAVTGIGAYSGELDHLPGEIKLFRAASRHEYGTRNAGLIAGLAEAVRLQEPSVATASPPHGRGWPPLLDGTGQDPRHHGAHAAHAELRGSMTTITHARAGAGRSSTISGRSTAALPPGDRAGAAGRAHLHPRLHLAAPSANASSPACAPPPATCESWLPVHSASSATSSISTGAPAGSELTPTAARACRPASPNTATSRSEAPFTTFGCAVKSSVQLTKPPTRTMRFTFARSPTSAFRPR
jgi:hypothetical protein